MKRLLITRDMPQATIAAARAAYDVTHRTAVVGLSPDEARQALQDYDAILCTLGDQFTAESFQGGTRCRMIANFGVGYNHIDLDAARTAGIAVTNTPDVVTDATADIALTLILATCRRAGEGERLVRAGHWDGWSPTQMLGQHVTGKTVGIIGMGRIGQAVARRCHFGFGMPVLYLNRSRKTVDLPAQQVATLPELMAQSDIVVVTVPGGGANKKLVDAAAIQAMQPHGVLVNVARGDVVDEPALIAALQSGSIGGAGLDVYAAEPVVPEALKSMENVVLLPHLGTAALEVREAMGRMALANIAAWDAGETLPNGLNDCGDS